MLLQGGAVPPSMPAVLPSALGGAHLQSSERGARAWRGKLAARVGGAGNRFRSSPGRGVNARV